MLEHDEEDNLCDSDDQEIKNKPEVYSSDDENQLCIIHGNILGVLNLREEKQKQTLEKITEKISEKINSKMQEKIKEKIIEKK